MFGCVTGKMFEIFYEVRLSEETVFVADFGKRFCFISSRTAWKRIMEANFLGVVPTTFRKRFSKRALADKKFCSVLLYGSFRCFDR